MSLPPKEQARYWPQSLIVFYSAFIVGLAATILLVALPYMAGSLALSSDAASRLLLPSRGLFLVGLLIGSRLSNGVGAKRAALLAATLFTVAALIGAFAANALTIVVATSLQGFASGWIISCGFGLLATLPPPKRRAEMLGLFLCCNILGAILGPVTGGLLTESLTWRWVFLVLVPAGLVLMLLEAFVANRPDDPAR